MRYFINKNLIQKSLDETIAQKKYTEEYGRQVLALADVAVIKRGLYYRFSDFEIDYIIKPKIVDDLLIKCFSYNKERAIAFTFLNRIITTAILDGIRKIRMEKLGVTEDVFYYENMKEVMEDDSLDYDSIMDMEVVFDVITNNKKK